MNFSLACTLIPFLRDARIPFTLLASQWNPNFLWFSYGFPMDFVNLPEGHPLVSGLDLLFELTPLINQFWFLGWSSKQIEWMLKEHDPEMSRVFSISMLNYWTEMSQYFSKCILTYIPMKSTIKFEYLEIYTYIHIHSWNISPTHIPYSNESHNFLEHFPFLPLISLAPDHLTGLKTGPRTQVRWVKWWWMKPRPLRTDLSVFTRRNTSNGFTMWGQTLCECWFIQPFI